MTRMATASPNILYIHSHDTGRYIEPYGHNIPAPNIQSLAEEGILFRRAFCGGPTCSPSRACLLTGQCAHSNGMLGLAHRGFRLHDYGRHIVNTLRSAGYSSALAGIQHITKNPEEIGYDRIIDTRGRGVRHVAPAAVEFFEEDPEGPFFLSVGFSETHRRYLEPGPGEDPRYTLPPHPIPDTPETRRDMAGFKASVRVFDRGVGTVIDALDANGYGDDTLVICTTDHGIAFPYMKCNLTDHGIGVMLIMRGPGGFSGGKVCDSLVSQIDIYPTLCELLDIDPPEWLEGSSMMPLIRGEREEINEQIYAEVTYHAAYEPQRAVRTDRWKYIRRFGGRDTPVLPNCDESLTKDLWLENGWRERRVAEEQLFDLVFDPNEANNLVRDPSFSDVLEDMRGRLQAWMRRTDDPILEGEVNAPKGAVITDTDALTPKGPTRTVT